MCLQEGCGAVEEEAVGILGEGLPISLIPVERKVLAVEVSLACLTIIPKGVLGERISIHAMSIL